MSKVINSEVVDNTVIIETEGYLNKDLGEEIQKIALEHIDAGQIKIVINLKESNIVNSIGASIIIELIEKLQEVDGEMVFCNLAPIIEKTFKIMGLTKYCKTYPTREEAVDALS